jgi:hypothetical protein
MPIAYDETSYLLTLIWTSTRFVSGGGSTTLGLNGPPESAANVQDLVDIGTAAAVDLLPEIDPDYTISGVRGESASFSVDGEGAGPGSKAPGDMTPPAVCALYSRSATGKGPRFRGRQFWPNAFLERTQVAETGLIVTSRLETLGEALDTFYAALVDGTGFVHSIPQSDEVGQKSEPNLPWPEIVAGSLQPKVASQRRRNRR